MSKTISAAANPALANNLLNKMNEEESLPMIEPEIMPPLDTAVELPGGYITDTGEVIRIAEVRELNGKDEEAISRSTNLGKALITILNRCVVKIGDQKADEQMLDSLLTGDRDALLLGILKVTFGSTPKVAAFCAGCNEVKEVLVDVNTDIKTKVLTNPAEERYFVVETKAGDATVKLPDGLTQKELINNADKTSAELTTVLLKSTVLKLGSMPVVSDQQVQNLSLNDRRKIVNEINKRIPGPQFETLTTVCPDCEGEVSVPVTLDSLFRI